MTALPKPVRRGPKPPRRIRRTKRPNPFKEYLSLEKLCDDTFALIVRIRGANRCKLCRRGGDTQCAHLISRRYHQCRHNFDNAWCLCRSCHARWTHDPLGWDDLMERTFGAVEWGRRKQLAQVQTRPDYSAMRLPLRLLLLAEANAAGDYGLDAQVEKLLLRHDGKAA
jgi:hypothetical protein